MGCRPLIPRRDPPRGAGSAVQAARPWGAGLSPWLIGRSRPQPAQEAAGGLAEGRMLGASSAGRSAQNRRHEETCCAARLFRDTVTVKVRPALDVPSESGGVALHHPIKHLAQPTRANRVVLRCTPRSKPPPRRYVTRVTYLPDRSVLRCTLRPDILPSLPPPSTALLGTPRPPRWQAAGCRRGALTEAGRMPAEVAAGRSAVERSGSGPRWRPRRLALGRSAPWPGQIGQSRPRLAWEAAAAWLAVDRVARRLRCS
jgi:hypothetical protein